MRSLRFPYSSMRLMEIPEVRKKYESVDLSVNGDMQKELRYRLKERL